MSDVVSQLEAAIKGIEERTPHRAGDCILGQGFCRECGRCFGLLTAHRHDLVPQVGDCRCDWQARVRAEIARRWEASVNAGLDAAAFGDSQDEQWAAAFRATQEQEIQK